MESNNSESTKVSPKTSQLVVRLALLVGAAILVLILVSVIYQQIKSKSYARLAPMAVSLELSYSNQLELQNEVILEYDYGYGFIPAHRQTQIIQSGNESKVIEFSISSWKAARGLRLSVAQEQGVDPRAVTFSRLDDSTRVLLGDVESEVLLDLQDAALLFSDAFISSSKKGGKSE